MRRSNNSYGFTLIEVIVTIVVSAIFAVMLMQFMQGHSWRSYQPLIKMDEGLILRQTMEQISADYRNLLISNPQPLVTLQNRIRNGAIPPNGYWSGQSYTAAINVINNYCLELNEDGMAPAGEFNIQSNCNHPADTLLKVTISYDQQSLTALFAR